MISKLISKFVSGIVISALIFSSISLPSFASKGTKKLDFSGHTWTIKSGHSGPGPNDFDDSDASIFLDSSNQLHLKVSKIADKWYSSEVFLPSSLGYGTYEFETVNDITKTDRNLVVGLFLYQNDEHEIDIEASRWEDSDGENYQYVVQPYKIKGNMQTYDLSLSQATTNNIIEWSKDSITFKTVQDGQTLLQWTYTGENNFVPGSEKVHINFWMIDGQAPYAGTDQETVIKSFKFTAPTTPTTPTTPTESAISPAPTPTATPTPNNNKGNSKSGKTTFKTAAERIKEILKLLKEKTKKPTAKKSRQIN
ncbi:MAG: glycoside hydrolase family 16 protein [Candidatus Gracilibacteria bacterium]|jgi:hypothetical protein